MSRSLEGRFQDRFLAKMREQGLLVQKFNDNFTEGIPDTLVALPMTRMAKALNGVLPEAVWVELKALDEWPKRPNTPIPEDKRPRLGQRTWAKAWDMNPHPVVALMETPDGWILLPQRDWGLFDGSHTELRKLAQKGPITYARLFRDWRLWRSA